MRIVRGCLAWVVVVSTLVTGGAAITPAEERTCLPDGGHEVTLGTDRTNLTVSGHASLLAPGDGDDAFGLALDGVSGNQTVLVFRTGVVHADAADEPGADPLARFAFAFDAGARIPGADRAVDVDHGRVDDTIDTAC